MPASCGSKESASLNVSPLAVCVKKVCRGFRWRGKFHRRAWCGPASALRPIVVKYHPKSLLRYRDEDCEMFDVEELSRRAQVSRSFIRLCIDVGCPTTGPKLSQSMLLEWLFLHYEKVRVAAGLKPMASIEGVSGDALLRLMMGNAMITLLEYCEMRASHTAEKQQLGQVRQLVEHTLERQ
jgi:hypothetical protein